MDIEEFTRRYEQGLQQLPEKLLTMYKGLGLTAMTLVQNRIQERGQDSNDAPLRPYSTTYLEYKEGKAENPYGVEPKKLASNRFRGFVDYTLTGAMWNNIGILQAEFSSDGILISLGAMSSDNQAKVDNLSNLREDIFLMSGTEQNDILPELADEELQRVADQLFPN